MFDYGVKRKRSGNDHRGSPELPVDAATSINTASSVTSDASQLAARAIDAVPINNVRENNAFVDNCLRATDGQVMPSGLVQQQSVLKFDCRNPQYDRMYPSIGSTIEDTSMSEEFYSMCSTNDSVEVRDDSLAPSAPELS